MENVWIPLVARMTMTEGRRSWNIADKPDAARLVVADKN